MKWWISKCENEFQNGGFLNSSHPHTHSCFEAQLLELLADLRCIRGSWGVILRFSTPGESYKLKKCQFLLLVVEQLHPREPILRLAPLGCNFAFCSQACPSLASQFIPDWHLLFLSAVTYTLYCPFPCPCLTSPIAFPLPCLLGKDASAYFTCWRWQA